jgi:hypothetical protein
MAVSLEGRLLVVEADAVANVGRMNSIRTPRQWMPLDRARLLSLLESLR